MSAYRIVRNKPFPKTVQRNRNWNPMDGPKYPFGKMKVGDAFAVPVEKAHSVRAAASMYAADHDMRFRVRQDENGAYFCWRVQ